MDVFWAVRGGARPVDLFAKYPDRFALTHLKDMKKGTAVGDPTGHAPDDSNVPLGEGMIDWAPIVRAANKPADQVSLHRRRGAERGAADSQDTAVSCCAEGLTTVTPARHVVRGIRLQPD